MPDDKSSDGNALDEWKEARSTISRFDGYLDALRKYGFTVVAGLLAANSIQIYFSFNNFTKFFLAVITVAFTVGLYLLDIFYQRIIDAASLRARIIETAVLNLELNETISYRFTKDKLSTYIKWIYIMFIIIAIVIGILVIVTASPSPLTTILVNSSSNTTSFNSSTNITSTNSTITTTLENSSALLTTLISYSNSSTITTNSSNQSTTLANSSSNNSTIVNLKTLINPLVNLNTVLLFFSMNTLAFVFMMFIGTSDVIIRKYKDSDIFSLLVDRLKQMSNFYEKHDIFCVVLGFVLLIGLIFISLYLFVLLYTTNLYILEKIIVIFLPILILVLPSVKNFDLTKLILFIGTLFLLVLDVHALYILINSNNSSNIVVDFNTIIMTPFSLLTYNNSIMILLLLANISVFISIILEYYYKLIVSFVQALFVMGLVIILIIDIFAFAYWIFPDSLNIEFTQTYVILLILIGGLGTFFIDYFSRRVRVDTSVEWNKTKKEELYQNFYKIIRKEPLDKNGRKNKKLDHVDWIIDRCSCEHKDKVRLAFQR
jgi:hypothetical protein